MSDYRRFITYFYEYDHGVKGTICGFGKIECNMRSRIQLSLKTKRSGREECLVYGISGKQEEDQLLGQFVLTNGKGTFLWEWNGKDRAANLFVRNMVGIVLYLKQTKRLLCATRWDGVEFCAQPQERIPEQVCDNTENDSPKEPTTVLECVHSENSPKIEIVKSVEVVEKQPMELLAASVSEKVVSYQCLEDKDAIEEVTSCSQWEWFCHVYAKFLPFVPSYGIKCLKLRLEDLALLPKSNEGLENNYFLLHGYYRCHYIVLVKRTVNGETTYYIGIPGIYQQKEARIADQFGFCVFVPYKGGKTIPGACGLWMKPVILEQEQVERK